MSYISRKSIYCAVFGSRGSGKVKKFALLLPFMFFKTNVDSRKID